MKEQILYKPSKRTGAYFINNKVKLVHGGREYFTLLEEMINSAQYSVHLQTYIFNDDETGYTIGKTLIKAAKKGIQVYLLADGYASRHLSKQFIEQLESAGINFRFFEPILKSDYFYFGRRLHHKVVVTDAKCGLVGGVNIADRYNDCNGSKAWKDMAIYVEGEVATDLFRYCHAVWHKEKLQLRHSDRNEKQISKISSTEKCSVRIRRNDWVTAKREIWKTYFYLFNNASESIIIMCSYFLPGQELRRALSRATKRGVRVKVILAGPSDVLMVKYAERYLYNWMIRNNIEIYEYQPTILHAKLAVVDRHWVTIGSYNINNISAYASIELNLDIRNKPFASNVHMELDEIIASECNRITHENLKFSCFNFNILMQKFAYEIIRLLLYLFTFYFRQEE